MTPGTALLFSVLAASPIQIVSTHDAILGHAVERGSDGALRSWYRPETPGAAFGHVALLASDFLARRCPVEPKTGLPFYLISCGFEPKDAARTAYSASDWPHNPACFFAGAELSLAQGAYPYTGDPAYLSVVQKMLDYALAHGTTPADFAWPNLPYSSANPFEKEYRGATRWFENGNIGDGPEVLQPDKAGELGGAYAAFYEITGQQRYLDAALACADTLAARVRDVVPDSDPLKGPAVDRSPWPFRVNARTGAVVSDYTANVLPPVRLLRELQRIGARIGLSEARRGAYARAESLAWRWLFSRAGPMATFVWNGYFEDIPNDPARANRVEIIPVELAKYLLRHPETDPDAEVHVRALLYWVQTAFRDAAWEGICEQTWCFAPMGSHTSRFGSLCALAYERTRDPALKAWALTYLNFATYMTGEDGYVAVGPNWPSAWWSDGYGDYIRHFFDALGAVPAWAPPGEDHLLRSDSAVREIRYAPGEIALTAFDPDNRLVFRTAKKPRAVLAGGKALTEFADSSAPGYRWEALASGGVLHVSVLDATDLRIAF